MSHIFSVVFSSVWAIIFVVHGPGIETSLQNGLMATGYAVVFLTVLSSRRFRRMFPALLIASLAAVIFNLVYDTAIHFPWALSVALFFRLAPSFEACWIVCYRKQEIRCALVGMAGVLVYSCTNPQAVSIYGYITIRNLATVGMTIICVATAAVNWAQPFGSAYVYVRNLQMQALWMCLHSLFSLTSKWYTVNWERRYVARWIYILSAVAITLIYRHIFTSQRALEGAEEEGF